MNVDRELLAAVGRRIKVARQNAGMHPQGLADLAHVTLQTVYRWEGGRVDMGIAGLALVARLLGVSAARLLGEDPGRPPEPGP